MAEKEYTMGLTYFTSLSKEQKSETSKENGLEALEHLRPRCHQPPASLKGAG